MVRSIASIAVLAAAGCGVASNGTYDSPRTTAPPGAPLDAGASIGSNDAPDAADAIDASPPGPADDASLPPPPPSCPGAPAWKPGDEKTIALDHGGQSRSYVVHVGTTATMGIAAPLLVNVHGLNNSPQIQEAFSGMNAIADAKGFVVVYPQGLQASFNATGGCCGYAGQNGVDDVDFVRAVVADAEKSTCVDARRVYVTGFSNGGYMAHTLGCVASDLFAAIAPVSGVNDAPTCDPGRAIPVIEFHGDADPIVAYSGGQKSASDWAGRDHCAGAPARTSFGASYCDEWSACDDGAKVRFCTIAGGSHLWPGGGAAIDASPMIWDFLTQFTLPASHARGVLR